MARARKPDKWKLKLDEVEEKHRKLEERVAALETERDQLMQREEMLSVVAEGLGAVMHHLQQHHHQQEEQHSLATQQIQDLKCRAQLLEQHIQMAIQHLNEPPFWPAECFHAGSRSNSSRCSQESGAAPYTVEPKHYSTVLLQSIFEPSWFEQVLRMSLDDTVARLRLLVGRCAIMAVKAAAAGTGPSAAAAAAAPSAAAASAASSTAAACGLRHGLTQHSSSSSMAAQQHIGWYEPQQQLWSVARESAAAAGPAAISADGCGDGVSARSSGSTAAPAAAAAAAAGFSGSAAAAAYKSTLPAPLEYAALLLTLMLFDETRFASIQFMDLETGQRHVPPTEFWGSVGVQMLLTPKQLATLTASNNMMQAALAPLYKSISQGAKQAVMMAVQQEQQPLPRLLHAHTAVVQQQGSALSQIKMLALQMGIVAVNTLSMQQMALQQSLAYPYCPRMDLILKGMEQQNSSGS